VLTAAPSQTGADATHSAVAVAGNPDSAYSNYGRLDRTFLFVSGLSAFAWIVWTRAGFVRFPWFESRPITLALKEGGLVVSTSGRAGCASGPNLG